MHKRLQVLLNEDEYKEYQEIARSSGTTLSEWVRQALRRAMRDQLDIDAKLEAIANASRHAYPTANIEDMLREIEKGRSPDEPLTSSPLMGED